MAVKLPPDGEDGIGKSADGIRMFRPLEHARDGIEYVTYNTETEKAFAHTGESAVIPAENLDLKKLERLVASGQWREVDPRKPSRRFRYS